MRLRGIERRENAADIMGHETVHAMRDILQTQPIELVVLDVQIADPERWQLGVLGRLLVAERNVGVTDVLVRFLVTTASRRRVPQRLRPFAVGQIFDQQARRHCHVSGNGGRCG